MKPGDVADIRIGTQLNKTSIAMSQGGASVGHVDVMSIRSWEGGHCFAAASKTPDVLTRQPFHV